MTFEEQWLSMAVGAFRAAGLAAAALGYHVWRLLTKQELDGDLEDTEEVPSPCYTTINCAAVFIFFLHQC